MIDSFTEQTLRFFVFFAVLIVMAVLELVRPRRTVRKDKVQRWLTNLSLVALDSLLIRAMAALAVPIAAVAAAVYAETNGIGLFNVVAWPAWLEIIIAVVALDFAVWLQHVASHKVPLLWRLHQVHHADPEIDVTTGIRFHPVEIGISMLWKIVCVLALGAAPLAVFLFEVILNAGAMFSHANVALPSRVDSLLRTIFVTPDMHRVHHSVIQAEHDSNYGFNLSVWDRMFRTYRQQPEKGHEDMMIGLNSYHDEAPTRLGWCLKLPFGGASR